MLNEHIINPLLAKHMHKEDKMHDESTKKTLENNFDELILSL